MATIFLDTETTGLDPDGGVDEIWEIAAVKRASGLLPPVWTMHMFVEHDVDKAMRLPEPFLTDYLRRYDPERAISRKYAASALGDLFARADGEPRHELVGAVPDFDTAGLRQLMQVSRSKSPWHYHITDVETLVRGFLAGRGIRVPFPIDSDELSRLVGVDASLFERHTAMGDVRWTIANYDAVTHHTVKNPMRWALQRIVTDPVKTRDEMRQIAQSALAHP